MTAKVGAVMALWAIVLFSLHWFLLARGAPQIVLRGQFIASLLVAAVLGVELLQTGRLRTLWPLTAYAVFVILYAPHGYNPAQAVPFSKGAQLVLLMAVGTLTLIRHPLHVRTIVLVMLLYRFAWYGLLGLGFGGVRFHSTLANPDRFGSLMAMGVVAAASVGMAAKDPWLRKLGAGVALLSVAGLVSSFARGAFLVGGLSIAFLWFRMDGRRLALAALVVMAAAIVIVVGNVFTGEGRGRSVAGNWFTELSSVSDDIADTEAEDRRLIWRIGWQVFEEHPVLGVGHGSWSAYASENYTGPILGERFSRRPDRLWGRAMHNIYLEALADIGLVGFTLFMAMIVDYWRRILAIRRSTPDSDMSVLPGLRTKMIATGFEASMVALLGAGMLYNVVDQTFFGLIIANALFHRAWARQQELSRGHVQQLGLRRRAGRGVRPSSKEGVRA